MPNKTILLGISGGCSGLGPPGNAPQRAPQERVRDLLKTLRKRQVLMAAWPGPTAVTARAVRERDFLAEVCPSRLLVADIRQRAA